jgi:hypothetical protein
VVKRTPTTDLSRYVGDKSTSTYQDNSNVSDTIKREEGRGEMTEGRMILAMITIAMMAMMVI